MAIRILVSGYHNPRFETITEYIEKAIAQLGYQVSTVDDRRHIIPGRIRKRSKVINQWDLRYINSRFSAAARRSRPELFIVTGGNRVLPVTVEKIKKLGCTSVLWTTDAPIEFSSILRAAPFYDYIFCQGSEAVKIFSDNKIESHLLPMACSPDFHYTVELTPNERQTLSHDIVFVGSYYPNRAELFKKLTCFDFAIWGPGWQQLEPSSGLQQCLKGRHTPPALWRKIYSSAKIVLATHFKSSETTFAVYQASPRIFEAMACGAFVITDEQKDVLSLFEDSKHLISYNNSEDLKDKIKYFLNNNEERDRIAKQGQAEVLKRHTYAHRIEYLISAYRKHCRNNE